MPATLPAEDDGDALLVGAARRGDRAAFEELVKHHQSNVRRQFRHALRGNAAVADELAQDTFVLAWRRLSEFRGEARFATWLHRIARRRFLMHLRGASSRIESVASSDIDAAASEAGADDADALRLDVARALAALPEAQRTAIFHCFHLDLSHDEAAVVLGWPVGTLKSHIARGKARLRKQLAAWAPATEAKHEA